MHPFIVVYLYTCSMFVVFFWKQLSSASKYISCHQKIFKSVIWTKLKLTYFFICICIFIFLYYYRFVCMDGEYRVALSTFWGQNGNMGCIWCVRHFSDRICNCTFIVMRIFIYLKNLNAENKEYFLVTKMLFRISWFLHAYIQLTSRRLNLSYWIRKQQKPHMTFFFSLFFFLSNKTEPSKVIRLYSYSET